MHSLVAECGCALTPGQKRNANSTYVNLLVNSANTFLIQAGEFCLTGMGFMLAFGSGFCSLDFTVTSTHGWLLISHILLLLDARKRLH